MPNLIIIDEKERQRIREALQNYMRLHGNIGAPALQERMMAMLGLLDSQLPLSTLQRFLKAQRRTDDFMVRRYQKFLQLVAPLSYADELGAALDNAMLYPISPPRPDVVPFEGRYELTVRALGSEDARDMDGLTRGLVLTPTRNPLLLKSIYYYTRPPYEDEGDEPVTEFGSFGAFVPCGINQFLLSSARFANASFALLSPTQNDPIVLQSLIRKLLSNTSMLCRPALRRVGVNGGMDWYCPARA